MPAPCFANGWGTAISIPFKPATVFRDQGGFDSGKKKTIFFFNLGRLKFLKKIPFSVENLSFFFRVFHLKLTHFPKIFGKLFKLRHHSSVATVFRKTDQWVAANTSSKCCLWFSSRWNQLGSSLSLPKLKAFWLVLSRISAPITVGGTGHLVKNHIEENAHLMRIIKRGSAELNIADGVVELESQPAFFCGTGSGSTQKRLKRQKYGKFGKPQTNLNFFF